VKAPALPFQPPKALGETKKVPPLLGSPWQFRQHGQSGLWVSDLLPETATRDDLRDPTCTE
jgi:hypothetical protein